MEAIERGAGTTKSERYLAKLADVTFLDLWSYPNTFNDRQQGGAGIGKELCDLLVVCGDNVIVFSDKSITWPPGDDVHLSWSRWYRRAVKKSVDQLRGAERWLRLHPGRIYIDPACTKRLPIDLPPPDRMRVHGIAIALGAQGACSRHYGDEDGSMMMQSRLKGPMHIDRTSQYYLPFAFGDVDPDGPFVHVFDETALNLVLFEMDTITDFVGYLVAREGAVRGEKITIAPSEAEMLAIYLKTDVGDGEHGFPTPELFGGRTGDIVQVPAGLYREYRQSAECRAKSEANRVSRVWDRLIGEFTGNLIAGTAIAVGGIESEAAQAERALRGMALEDRTGRRALAQVFVGALEEAERRKQDRFARIILPNGGLADPECGHVFLVITYRQPFMIEQGYQKYREVRASMLRAYCEVALLDNRQLKRMLGIAIDASPTVTGRSGSSEDLVLVEVTDWTPEHVAEAERLREFYDILRPSRLRRGSHHAIEYPPQPVAARPVGNRQERRAAKSRDRRRR